MPRTDTKQFSDYIIYIDESGDHGLMSIDPYYPVFVLVFCIFQKQEYADKIIPALVHFKTQFWGHSEVVLHEHNIRKPEKEFTFLFDKSVRETFMAGLSNLISSASFMVIAAVIDKKKLIKQYWKPDNPYELSLSFGLERAYRQLDVIGQSDRRTAVIVEKRGRREDEELELVFRRICDGANFLNRELLYDLVMTDKKANSAGLQIADLIARPIGIKTLRPQQVNRAYDIISGKFRTSPAGKIKGWGLKIFP